MNLNVTVFKVLTCLLLVIVVALLVYDVRISHGENNRNDKEAVSDRSKRSASENKNGNGNPKSVHGGATYTRWGKASCEENGTATELVYAGVAGGSFFDHHGGGSNYLCMPMDPEWGHIVAGVQNNAIVYGAEYENSASGLNNHNIPCAVCRSIIHSSVVMIPAKMACHDGWTVEYTGYLMAGHHVHKGRNQFVCMDKEPEADPAGYRDENGILFYPAEGACGSLPCPPYEAGKELTCVVCSK